MTARFADHLLGPGTHASRPSASTTPYGALYECTTHNLIYQNVAGTWSTYAAVLPSGGTIGQVPTKNSSTDGDYSWATPAGGGSSYQPGSADKPPTSANAKDDEFDGTSSVTWTTTPTAPTSFDINTTRASHAYLKTAGPGAVLVGKYQAVPGAYPFTITTKVFSTGRADFHKAGGIVLIPATPTSSSSALLLSHTARSSSNSGVQRTVLTLGGTFSSESSAKGLPQVSGPANGPRYLRVKVNSATSVDTLCSSDGYTWLPIESAFNPGFTPAFMGLVCNEESSGGGVEAYFDFFRVT